MIEPDADPIGHRPPYKRIDLGARRRKSIITKEDYDAGEMPDEEFYWFDFGDQLWKLKE